MRRVQAAAFDLKAEREKRELSQIVAAEILCTTQTSISRWEATGTMPGVYRKVWIQHWQLVEAANGKANRATNKRAAGAKRSGNKIGNRAARTKQRGRKSQEIAAARDTNVSVSDESRSEA